MKVEVRDESAWRKVLSIEVAPEELQQDYDAALEDYRRKAVIPGFRKGKVPKTMLESQFGHSLEHEVLERAVRRAYQEAVKEKDLEPVEYPAIDKISYEKGKPLSFEAAVDIRPVVTARNYEGLEMESTETAVPDAEIDRALEDQRDQEEALVSQLLERNPLELPQSMIAGYLEEVSQRLKGEGEQWTEEQQAQFLVEYRPHAERRLKRDILLDAIVRAEGITVPEEEVDETLRGASEGSLPPPEMERLIRNAAQRERARVHLAERKVFALLRGKAKVKMAVGSPDV